LSVGGRNNGALNNKTLAADKGAEVFPSVDGMDRDAHRRIRDHDGWIHGEIFED
jgi:hypothetical protein